MRMMKPALRTMDTRTCKPAVRVKATDPHYGTAAHKQWAAKVIERDGGVCRDPEHKGSTLGLRVVADHIVEIKDGGAALDLANGRATCWSCHSRKTAAERGRRTQGAPSVAASFHPDWLRPSVIPLVVVCGPPGSGKSTYVEARRSGDDAVIDLDEIMAKVSGLPLYTAGREWLSTAVRERNDMLGRLSHRRPGWPRAWFIVSEPSAQWRDWWERMLKPQSIVVCLTSEGDCLDRIDRDQRRASSREQRSEAVMAWWNAYTPRQGDTIVTV